MARTRSAGAEATTAQASTPPLAPEPANPSASAIQPSAGTGAGPSAPEVEHTASGMFEVDLKGLGASAQDIEALRRIRALIAGKSAAAQQEQETRPSSSQAQPSQQQDVVPLHTALTPSTSTSGRPSATSHCCKARSLARRRRSRPPLRHLPQHRRLPRMLHRRPSSMPGTPCKPCRLSWINGGSRRTHPKGKALATARRGGRHRSTSRPMTHRFVTSSRCPRS
jgi:hypothetical protein